MKSEENSFKKGIARVKNLGSLLVKIKQDQMTFQEELEKWNDLLQHNAFIQERLEQACISNYLFEAKNIQETWTRPFTEVIDK